MASGPWLNKHLEDVAPLVDDHPVIEYSHKLVYSTKPKELFWAGSFLDWCPSCFIEGVLDKNLEPLDSFLSLMQSYYWNKEVLQNTPRKLETTYNFSVVDTLPSATTNSLIRPIQLRNYNDMIENYPYLKMLGFSKITNN